MKDTGAIICIVLIKTTAKKNLKDVVKETFLKEQKLPTQTSRIRTELCGDRQHSK